MKIIALNSLLLVTMLSCTSSTEKKNDTTDSTNKVSVKESAAVAAKFDLSLIKFSENIDDLLKSESLTLKDGTDTESTIMGYESFASSAPQLMVYNNRVLTGGKTGQKNMLVMHYATKGHQLNMYELKLYDAAQTRSLESDLQAKLGKPVFAEDSGLNKNSIQLDENGDEDKGPREDKKFLVWEDKTTGVSYFFIEVKVANKITYGELTAINTKSKNAEIWIKFRGFNWYKK